MASFFGTVVDFIFDKTNAFNPDKIENTVKRNNFSSLSAKASEGILQFPMIVSDSISYETATLISKACERSYASFANIVFSMNQDFADVGSGNVSDYLHRFHQNDGQSTTDTDRGSLNDIIESFEFNDSKSGVVYECDLYQPSSPIMVNELKAQLKPYLEDFCMTKLNDLYQPERIVNAQTTLSMEGWREPEKKVTYAHTLLEADNNVPSFQANEVKKANELQPTFIKVHIVKKVPNGNNIEYNFIVGIKCTIHLVRSTEFISNLVDACEYKGTLFRFIKWTSGEIGFLTDFVLRMDLFEKEVKNKAASKSGWWDALKQRARSAKLSKVASDRLLPNATFVFTREEADTIKANYGYDLLNTSVARSLMKEYFLLGYICVDSSDETVRIMYDGQSKFQFNTFKSLERENSNQERAFKEMLRDVRKM